LSILFISVIIPIEGRFVGNQENFTLDDYEDKIEFLMRMGHIPSLAACIVKNDSLVWSKAYGYSDIKQKKHATLDTVYPIASVTKLITATAIMQLYDQGEFDLDDDVSNYLPFELRNPKFPDDPITFRMILAHHSSLDNELLRFSVYFALFGYPYGWLEEYLLPNGSVYNPKVWLDSSPGETAQYTSIGYEILGYLVEEISGQPYDEYCEEHIFLPLDMKNTGFHLSEYKKSQLAIPYIWRGGLFIPILQIEPKIYASAGIRSTVLDLSHFLIAHMNDGTYNGTRILSEESLNLSHTIQYENSYYQDYQLGLGWGFRTLSDGKMYEGQAGSYPGCQSVMRHRLEDDVGVIFFWNQNKMTYFLLEIRNPLERYAHVELKTTLFKMGSLFN